MRNIIIAGNWKMHKTISEACILAKTVNEELLKHPPVEKLEIIIAPPCTAINKVAEMSHKTPIKICAQNLFWEDSGAFTGEISALMLQEAGAEYVIIGHSERRQIFHETNKQINKKIKAAIKHNLIPILCIGETLEEREQNKANEIITNQLTTNLEDLTTEEIKKIIIAYEPIWAIGTGKTATPDEAEKMHIFIRKILTEKFGESFAETIKILYGGSVKPNNSKALLSQPNIDGALIGGASLNAEDFSAIIKNACQINA